MFETVKQWLCDKKERRQKERNSETIELANELYQICEYMGELWLTYDRHLICPCAMLKLSPVDAVREIRGHYLNRNKVFFSDANFESDDEL